MTLIGPQKVRRCQIEESDVATETSQQLVNSRPGGRVIPLRIVLREVYAERCAKKDSLASLLVLVELHVTVRLRLSEAWNRVVCLNPFHPPTSLHSELIIVKHIVTEIVGHSHDTVADLARLSGGEHESLDLKRCVELVIVVNVGFLGEELRHRLSCHLKLVEDLTYFLSRHAISLSSDVGELLARVQEKEPRVARILFILVAALILQLDWFSFHISALHVVYLILELRIKQFYVLIKDLEARDWQEVFKRVVWLALHPDPLNVPLDVIVNIRQRSENSKRDKKLILANLIQWKLAIFLLSEHFAVLGDEGAVLIECEENVDDEPVGENDEDEDGADAACDRFVLP